MQPHLGLPCSPHCKSLQATAPDLIVSQVQLMKPLVDERDLYLAWSLKRSKAVNGTKRVVGVLGLGHLQGVYHKMTTDSGGLRFRDLVKLTPEMVARQELSQRRWKVFNDVSLVATIAWLVYNNRTALQQLLPHS